MTRWWMSWPPSPRSRCSAAATRASTSASSSTSPRRDLGQALRLERRRAGGDGGHGRGAAQAAGLARPRRVRAGGVLQPGAGRRPEYRTTPARPSTAAGRSRRCCCRATTRRSIPGGACAAMSVGWVGPTARPPDPEPSEPRQGGGPDPFGPMSDGATAERWAGPVRTHEGAAGRPANRPKGAAAVPSLPSSSRRAEPISAPSLCHEHCHRILERAQLRRVPASRRAIASASTSRSSKARVAARRSSKAW